MGILDGQPVNAAITNPAFINKNLDDIMPNKLSFTRGLSGASIADVQVAVNTLYTCTGASEIATGTVYNAPAGTITDGQSHQTSLGVLANKFDAVTGHKHTGAAGDAPLLDVVRSLSVSGSFSSVFGNVTFSGVSGISILNSGNNFQFTGTGSGSGSGGGSPVLTAFFNNNQVAPADMTGFLVPASSANAFVSETSIFRQLLLNAEDTPFYTALGSSFGSNVRRVIELSDAEIVVGGDFITFDGNTRNRLVKLSALGVEDTSFYTMLGTAFNGSVYSLAQQADGRILVGGIFGTFNGNGVPGLVRLSAGGSQDATFTTNIGTGFTGGTVFHISVQTSDQSLVVAGSYTTFNSNTRNRIVRLLSTGVEDTTFYTNLTSTGDNSGYNGLINRAVVQADGKIVVVGAFTTLNGVSVGAISRLNSDGTIDTSFASTVGTGADASIEDVKEQPDGKLLLCGSFADFNGTSINKFIRLNSDGSEDTSFTTNIGTGFDFTVYSISLQANLDIVIGGNFTTFNGNTRIRLVKLTSTGTEDTAFYTALNGGFTGGPVISLYTQLNDQILAGGFFTSFGGNTRDYLIRFAMESELVSVQTLKGVYHSASGGTWLLGAFDTLGDTTGLSFSMLSTGQLQYTSSDLSASGSTILNQMKFNIVEL